MEIGLAHRVHRVFDPEPLEPREKELYVDLDDVRGSTGIVSRLGNRIRLSDKPTCQILAGHGGSGKSTELRRLQAELEGGDDPFFVVYCEADEDIDRNDVDFPEVLIAIVRQMAAQLEERLDISLTPGYFKDRWERLKKLMGSEVSFEKLSLQEGMLKVSGTIKSSPDARMALRQYLEPDTSNWLNAANDVIGEAILELRERGFRGLVIMVDDLDKMVLRKHEPSGKSTCEYLFVDREAQLSAFACHLVYTMPIALAYSAAEQTIANLYGGHPPVVPMTKVCTRPPNSRPHKAGIEKFRQMIATRLAKAEAAQEEVFETDKVRDDLIRLSGGQPRQLMHLVREAIIGGELPIGAEAVKRARDEGRRAFSRQLRAEHWPIITRVKKDGTLVRSAENDAAIRELLDSRAILQYVNEEDWYGVNPFVAEIKPPSTRKARA